jgi:preprotein translocase subunit YajC
MITSFLPFAAVAQGQPSGGSAMTAFFFQIAAILAIFYFLFIRPQQRQRKAHEDRVRQLKKGEEVVTTGGIVGEIVHIREGLKDGAPTPTMDDRITIKSGESRLVIVRGRIASVLSGEKTEVEKPK